MLFLRSERRRLASRLEQRSFNESLPSLPCTPAASMTHHFIRNLHLLLLCIISCDLNCCSAAKPDKSTTEPKSRHTEPTHEDVVFATVDGHELKLDLYRPKSATSPRPAVVFIHGGGWKNGSKKTARKYAHWLTDSGFVVAGIDYRLTDVAGWPAQINDCYSAVRWLRDNSERYGIDRENIGVWGTSAGAHLAALVGTRPYEGPETTPSSVKAVCDWFGPSDLMTMPPNNIGKGRSAEDVANSNGAKLLRRTVREVPALAHDASALHQVDAGDASFLIMHGDADPGVPFDQSTRLHSKLVAARVPSQLKVIAGAGHGGPLFQTDDSRQTVVRFFQRTLMPVWPQGNGPNGDFTASGENSPVSWSVVRNENIKWKKTLPETGQSTVTVWNDRVFFTTIKEVHEDSELGQNIVAWCCDATSGETIWTREIPGDYPLRLSGCFSDSSAPPAVTDGTHVVFFNASGKIACFDFDGILRWEIEEMAVGRSQPFLVGDQIVFTRQKYMPDESGNFTHDHENEPAERWTQLQTIDIRTGKPGWTSSCGVNMGSVPLLQTLGDGRQVMVVGRGGGHSPPEKPEGISMVDASDGKTLWTLPLEGFMSTMTMNVVDDRVLVFHDDEHLWVDAGTGQIVWRVSFLSDVPVRRHIQGTWKTQVEELPPAKKKRAIIQQSNVLVGRYHYFRSYHRPYLGRVHTQTGRVEYLQLPVQLKRSTDDDSDELLWSNDQMAPELVASLKKTYRRPPKELPIEKWCFAPNDMRNSRGFEVMGDARSRGSGWGHHAAQVPTCIGNRLYIPVMNGTVYVMDATAPKLDESAILSINDLGPVGGSFNRAGVSFAGGHLYAHTIRELICIGDGDEP